MKENQDKKDAQEKLIYLLEKMSKNCQDEGRKKVLEKTMKNLVNSRQNDTK